MSKEIYEIENILDSEIEVFSDMEKNFKQKRECLTKGDISLLAIIDEKIIKNEFCLNRLMEKRVEFNKKFGNNKLTLSEIIDKTLLIDKIFTDRLLIKKKKINKITENIKKINSINEELIKHGLNLVQASIRIIVDSVNPEMTAYKNNGKVNNDRKNCMSSIVREA